MNLMYKAISVATLLCSPIAYAETTHAEFVLLKQIQADPDGDGPIAARTIKMLADGTTKDKYVQAIRIEEWHGKRLHLRQDNLEIPYSNNRYRQPKQAFYRAMLDESRPPVLSDANCDGLVDVSWERKDDGYAERLHLHLVYDPAKDAFEYRPVLSSMSAVGCHQGLIGTWQKSGVRSLSPASYSAFYEDKPTYPIKAESGADMLCANVLNHYSRSVDDHHTVSLQTPNYRPPIIDVEQRTGTLPSLKLSIGNGSRIDIYFEYLPTEPKPRYRRLHRGTQYHAWLTVENGKWKEYNLEGPYLYRRHSPTFARTTLPLMAPGEPGDNKGNRTDNRIGKQLQYELLDEEYPSIKITPDNLRRARIVLHEKGAIISIDFLRNNATKTSKKSSRYKVTWRYQWTAPTWFAEQIDHYDESQACDFSGEVAIPAANSLGTYTSVKQR